MSESFSHLKTQLDSNDGFVTGHRVMKTAGATQHSARMKRIPVWALDDEKIKQLIQIRFPKAQTNLKQRKLAARIVRIIYLYYRAGLTASAIAEELKMHVSTVKKRIHLLEKHMKSPLKPSHRPKKKDTSIETTNETTGVDHISL